MKRLLNISRRTITSVLMLAYAVLLAISIVLVLLFNTLDYENSYFESAKNNTELYSKSIASEFNRLFSNVEKSTAALEICFRNKDYSRTEIEDLIKQYLANYPEVFGSAFAFNPNFSDSVKLSCPYYCKTSNGLKFVDLAGKHYNYVDWTWYKTPVETRQPYWTEPYFDKGGGNTNMITFARPIYSNSNKLLGVFTNDIQLKWIGDMYRAMNQIPDSRLYICDSQGKLIYPFNEKSKSKKLNDYFESDAGNNNWFTDLSTNASTNLKNGFILKDNQKRGFLFMNQVGFNNWKIVIFIPKENIFKGMSHFRLNDAVYLITALLLLLIVCIIIKSLSGKIKVINGIIKKVESGLISDGMKDAQKLLEDYRITENNVKEIEIKNEMLGLILNLNSMLMNLENLVLQSQKAGRQVNFSSDSLLTNVMEIEKVLVQQSSNLTSTGSTIDQIVESISNLNNNLALISDIANNVNFDAETGKSSLQEMEFHLGKINNDSGQLGTVLDKMQSETEGISDIINEINNIAHRTNMLSINVEIEAEKTSAILQEKGLNDNIGGFKIVAEKINELAIETAHSAVNIEEKIANIDDTIKTIIGAVINYLELITKTSATINAVSLNLNNIITKAQNLVEHFVVFKDSMVNQTEEIYNISSFIKSIKDCSENIQKSMHDFEHQIEKTNSSVKTMQSSLSNFSTDKYLL